MNMDKRWAIYIDIEGFSALYPKGNDALWALNKLMLAVHRIGTVVFPETPDRLFAHQLGDGFLIVSDFHEENLERAGAIVIFLMKYIASFGVFTRGAIAEGGLSGITGCYADEVMDSCQRGDLSTANMGAGLMTIFPVMGTALINAVGIDKLSPKGPLLTMPSEYKRRLSERFITTKVPRNEIISVDWVHTELELLSKISDKTHLKYPSSKALEDLLKNYVNKHELPPEWKDNCASYLGVKNGIRCRQRYSQRR